MRLRWTAEARRLVAYQFFEFGPHRRDTFFRSKMLSLLLSAGFAAEKFISRLSNAFFGTSMQFVSRGEFFRTLGGVLWNRPKQFFSQYINYIYSQSSLFYHSSKAIF